MAAVARIYQAVVVMLVKIVWTVAGSVKAANAVIGENKALIEDIMIIFFFILTALNYRINIINLIE